MQIKKIEFPAEVIKEAEEAIKKSKTFAQLYKKLDRILKKYGYK